MGYILNNIDRYQIIKAERNVRDYTYAEPLIVLDTKTSKVFIYDDFYIKNHCNLLNKPFVTFVV